MVQGVTAFAVSYTGDLDLDRHRTELAQLWGGPVCVVLAKHAQAELLAIQADLTGDVGKQLGLQMLGSGVSLDTIIGDAILVTPEIQGALDARYGAGTVLLTPALTPVH
jgi:hypothetical protein